MGVMHTVSVLCYPRIPVYRYLYVTFSTVQYSTICVRYL